MHLVLQWQALTERVDFLKQRGWIGKSGKHVVSGHRLAEEETLHHGAAEGAYDLHLLHGFYALSDKIHVKSASNRDDCVY